MRLRWPFLIPHSTSCCDDPHVGFDAVTDSDGAVVTWSGLTYTSFDSGGRGALGGWQVKQATADLGEDETAGIVSSLPTRLPLREALSQFPTPAEIQRLPRRLVYSVTAAGDGLFMHATHAGPDASGRPDNVFTQVIVRRSPGPAAGSAWRPIQLWGSSVWLAPYGSAQVRQAVFDDPILPPAGPLDRGSAVDFLLEAGAYRNFSFGFLLDAVACALAGGPVVVIAVTDQADAIAWLAAVSYFTAASVCHQLTFSSYERLSELASSARPALLSVVPVDDLVDAPPELLQQFQVFDPAHPAENVVIDGQANWRNRHGTIVPETSWSRLAADLCGEESAVVTTTLEAMDAIVQSCVETQLTPPSWPLAVAIAQVESMGASWPTAASVVLQGGPQSTSPDVNDTLLHLIRTVSGESAAEVWATLKDLSQRGQYGELAEILYTAYVESVVADADWLTSPTPAPLPAMPVTPSLLQKVTPSLVTALAQSASRLQSAISQDDAAEVTAAAVFGLRLLDFLARLQIEAPVAADVRSEMEPLSDALSPVLLRPGISSEVALAAGLVEHVTVHGYLGPVLDECLGQSAGMPGMRLDDVVRQWLVESTDLGKLAWRLSGPRDRLFRDVPLKHLKAEAIIAACDQGRVLNSEQRCLGVAALLSRMDRPVNHPDNRVHASMKKMDRTSQWELSDFMVIMALMRDRIDLNVELISITATALRNYVPEGVARDVAEYAMQYSRTRMTSATGAGDRGEDIETLLLYEFAGGSWPTDSDVIYQHGGLMLTAGLRLWPKLSAVACAALAPEILLVALCWAADPFLNSWRKQQLETIPPFSDELLALGLPGACDFVEKLSHFDDTFHRRFVSSITYALSNEGPASWWQSFFTAPLSAYVAGIVGCDSVGALVMRSLTKGKTRKEVHDVGIAWSKLGMIPTQQQTWRAWWASNVEPARGPRITLGRNDTRQRRH